MTALRRLFLLSLILPSTTAWSDHNLTEMLAQAGFREGSEYRVIAPTFEARDDDLIQVTVFFSYGCRQCNEFDRNLSDWITSDKPQQVRVERLAMPLDENWANQARAFYAAQELGILDPLHEALFQAARQDDSPPADAQALAQLAVRETGVDRSDFLEQLTAVRTGNQVEQAQRRFSAYHLADLPAVVVEERFLASAESADGWQPLLEWLTLLTRELAAGQ